MTYINCSFLILLRDHIRCAMYANYNFKNLNVKTASMRNEQIGAMVMVHNGYQKYTEFQSVDLFFR